MSTSIGPFQSLRSLRRRPAFSLAVVITLALGFGANAVIFSFVSALLLKPLPLHEPATLGWIFAVDPQSADDRAPVSLPDYARFRREATSFASLSGRVGRSMTLAGGPGGPLRVEANQVLGDLHGVWGLRAAVGRPLSGSDEEPTAPRAMVISHRFWQRAFGDRADVVGTWFTLDGVPHQIVGVLTRDIEFGNLANVEVWVPYPGDPALAAPEPHVVKVCGRLRPDRTVAQADAEVQAIAARLAAEQPATHAGWRARATDTHGALARSGQWFTLAMLFTVVVLLLVLACANVTNLQLVMLIERRAEHAVRAALGSPRGRIVRELLVEGLVLGVLGSACGVALAAAILKVVRAVTTEPIFESFVIDRNVVLFALALGLVAPLLFVVPAALRTLGRNPAAALRAGGRGADPIGRRSRSLLVGTQIAIALTLLVVSGLVVRSVAAQLGRPLGFDTRQVLTFRLELGAWRYASDADLRLAEDRLLVDLGSLPGVQTAALGSALPTIDAAPSARFARPGEEGAPDHQPWAASLAVSPGYFAALGIPVLAGRGFAADDRAGAPAVALVSRAAAERYLQGGQGLERALGTTLTVATEGGERRVRVVGVVADVAEGDPMRAPDPRLYLAAAQVPPRAFSILLRSSRPAALADSARRTVAASAPDVAIGELRTLADAIDAETSSDRLIAGLFAGFAVIALLLATVGLYGVLAYTAARRVRELAVRAACGATPRDLRRLLLGQGLRVAFAGSAFGLLAASLLARLMAAKLVGISPRDAVTFGGALAVILVCTLLAAVRPARRAGRTAPAVALRSE